MTHPTFNESTPTNKPPTTQNPLTSENDRPAPLRNSPEQSPPDHQTHSQIPDDAGKPPDHDPIGSYLSDRWAKIWDDLRPSVHPAWLGPGPEIKGIPIDTTETRNEPPSITWDDVKAMLDRLQLPTGPTHQIGDTLWYTHIRPGGGPRWDLNDHHTVVPTDYVPLPPSWVEHPPARVVPSVRVCRYPDCECDADTPCATRHADDVAHTCPGTGPWPAPCGRDTTHPAHPLGIPPTTGEQP